MRDNPDSQHRHCEDMPGAAYDGKCVCGRELYQGDNGVCQHCQQLEDEQEICAATREEARKVWITIAEALEKSWEERTPTEQEFTTSGLCYAVEYYAPILGDVYPLMGEQIKSTISPGKVWEWPTRKNGATWKPLYDTLRAQWARRLAKECEV